MYQIEHNCRGTADGRACYGGVDAKGGRERRAMSILKKARGKNDGKSGTLSLYTGVTVKVSAVDGPYLFTARLENVIGDRAQLSYLHSPGDVDLLRWTGQPFDVELRGYSKNKVRAIRGRGRVQHALGGIWNLTHITYEGSSDERSDYRYETDFSGIVTFPNRRSIEASCQVADLSMGGVCLIMTRPTAEGERLLLSASILAEAGIDTLPCLVCYNRFNEDGKLLCGCRFEELSSEVHAKLEAFLAGIHTPSRRAGK